MPPLPVFVFPVLGFSFFVFCCFSWSFAIHFLFLSLSCLILIALFAKFWYWPILSTRAYIYIYISLSLLVAQPVDGLCLCFVFLAGSALPPSACLRIANVSLCIRLSLFRLYIALYISFYVLSSQVATRVRCAKPRQT